MDGLDFIHKRIANVEKKLERNMSAPTLPKYDLTAVSGILAVNLGEIGNSIGTNLLGSHTMDIEFEDVLPGDGILVMAAAPSVPSLGDGPYTPFIVTDSVGNNYDFLFQRKFEDNPPQVNTGIFVSFWFCSSSFDFLSTSLGSWIRPQWSAPVYDRIVSAWIVRHAGGANEPTLLTATNDNDLTTYASNTVSEASGGWTPTRSQALELALFITAKAGGVGGFSGTGLFFQAQSRTFVGSKQDYLVNPQTFGANAYLVVGAGNPQYEIDQGTLDGGALVGSETANQSYSSGANAWKGAFIMGID